MVVIDSSVWIDFFSGATTKQTELLEIILVRDRAAIGGLILTEVLQGFRLDRDFRTARKLLLDCEFLPMDGLTLSLRSAENYRKLRLEGVTVRKTIDCLIATFCIEHSLPLLHSDRDFDPFEKHLGLHSA